MTRDAARGVGALEGPFYYRARLAKGGPFVGVAVIFGGPLVDGEIQDRSPRYQVIVGNERDGRMVTQGGAVPVEVENTSLRSVERITEAEHRYLLAHEQWAASTGAHPRARPREAVDFNTLEVRL